MYGVTSGAPSTYLHRDTAIEFDVGKPPLTATSTAFAQASLLMRDEALVAQSVGPANTFPAAVST